MSDLTGNVEVFETWLVTNRKNPRKPFEELATETKWSWIRAYVFERDGGMCQVCGNDELENTRYVYECGHIVDRCCGGSDHPSNLVCMCYSCNNHKPLHETEEEYSLWVRNGGWSTVDFLISEGFTIEEIARYVNELAKS